VDPVVASIQPDVGVVGSAVDVTVRGSGFQGGATLLLEGGQGPPATITDVTVVDESALTARLAIPTGGPKFDRLWTVRVTNPDGGAGLLSNGFTVTTSAAGITASVTR